MGTGDTGLLFTQDIGRSVDKSVVTTSNLENDLNIRSREKRASRKTGLSIPKFTSDKELNLRFQYLYDLI
ncbi:unnamed protein product [Allacma fusca]|uniref:Uncharacterized protein n=1 Tax=Allacma fusca TaxID=39272 RepID=A0A8J2PHA6_9HEXA|nr:unnamed protein product [Allacma fusca]